MPLLTQPSVYPLLVNVRAYVPGRLDSRAGIVAVNSNSLGGLIHSLKRLNDPLPGALNAYAILAGAGANLWLGQVGATPSPFAMIDTGYSGNPLGFVPYRPPNSPESWLYISDSYQMRKVRADGIVYPQGIAPPLLAPAVDFGVPLITVIEDFNEAVTTGWTNTGTAGALSAHAGGRITDTLTAPFNTGPGWCEYLESPSASLKSGYGRGMRLILNAGTPANADVVVVSAIYPSSLNSTIQAIQYDIGATGPCCIVPTSPSTLVNNLTLRGMLSKLARTWAEPFTAGANLQVQPNTVLALGGAAENILVLSATPGPLGTFSVRTSTVAHHAVGDSLTAVSSFRAYAGLAHANPVAATAGYFESTITTGVGTIDDAALAVDLSVIGTRPTQPTDEIHLSVRLDVPANLVEGRIIFDVDSATHDFTQNYYYASFQASQLTPAVASTSTTQAAIASSIVNSQIDQYNAMHPGGYFSQVMNTESPTEATTLASASVQAGTGLSQWTELFIPISNLIRVGTDTSRTLANVKGVRIYFKVSASTVCDVHGLYVKGSYGPDVGTVGNDYYYCYRRRSSLTGAKSNPSPYIRSGMRPHNQRLAVTLDGDATEGDQLDVFRWGGSVTQASATGIVPWFYVGSATNPGATNTVVFNDDFADSDILNAENLEFDNQQPYPTIVTPQTGTCTVVGTSVVWVSGDHFNMGWAPGSIIEINGVPYTLYAQPASTTFLEIVESATTLGAASTVSSTFRPSSFVQGVGVVISNPGAAYDNNPISFAGANIASGLHTYGYWIIPIPSGIVTFTSSVLSVLSGATDFSIPPSGMVTVSYSLDLGLTWTPLWSANNHGLPGGSILDQVSINLTGVTQVWVSVTSTCAGGVAGYEQFHINEIYIPATYSLSSLTPAPFILRQPTLLAQPMYAQWGPFLGYLQAVGDPYQPGVMHCTKPNQPDEGSDLLDVEITPPSEPLLNGCMFGNGASFVWSTQRMFQLASSADLGLQFTPTGGAASGVPFVPQEVPGASGLFAPWAFCVGDKIYYLTATGIVATTGGTPVSITDPYLSLLFPRDGQPGQPVMIGSATFQPPDMTQTQALRLFYEKDHVKFAYQDVNQTKQVIVYSVLLNVWSTDNYVVGQTDPEIVCLYSEEGQSINRNLAGGLNNIYRESGALEAGNAEGWQVRMAQVSDLPEGFIHGRDGYLGLMSSDDVSLIVNVDGTDYTHAVAATGGGYLKQYVPLQPMKGKAWEWAVTSSGSARLFLRDCFFNLKGWNGQKFQPFQPFRDLRRELNP